MPNLLTASPLRDDGSAIPRHRILLLTLTMTSSLGMVASTIYVPSIPAIAGAFATSIAHVQLTFVGYLLAFAASMLVLGPLSDRYGRRRTIICGLALSAVSSVACAVSPTIEFLIAARVIQGIGACAGLVVGRAITREVWGREAAARVIAGRSIAATLMSTQPVGSTTSRSTFSLMSVATPEARFGHESQSVPSGGSFASAAGSRRSSSRRVATNSQTASGRPERRRTTRSPSGDRQKGSKATGVNPSPMISSITAVIAGCPL